MERTLPKFQDSIRFMFLLTFFSLYLIYPRCAPTLESDDLRRLQALVPSIEEGEGRTFEMQTMYQLIGLVVTLSIALITGALTGL